MASWLTQFGLTEAEADIYQALLKQGAATAGMIAKQARQHRRTVYDAVERLLEKGLVGMILRNNRKHYLALNPQTLSGLLEAQEAAVEQLKHMANVTADAECHVQLFHGKTGLKQALEKQIVEGNEITVLNPCPTPETSLSFYFQKYEHMRKARKIQTIMVTTRQHVSAFAKLPYAQTRIIPIDLKDCATNIHGTSISFLVWKEPSFCLSIEHPQIAQGFRELVQLTTSVGVKNDT